MSASLLIVDDDELMRVSLQLQAQDAGYRVAVACNGPEAIALAKERPFDLVICDIRMPGMSGLDALSEIRELLPESRAIVVTGYASPDTPIAALKMRVDDYLLKPFDGDVFLASVDRVLKNYRRRTVGADPELSERFLQILNRVLAGDGARIASIAAGLGARRNFSPRRLRSLYLAGLLHDLEPDLLAAFPGLHREATIVSRQWDRRDDPATPLESLMLAAAAGHPQADPALLALCDQLPDEIELPADDTISLENLLGLADKHREASHWELSQNLYQQVEAGSQGRPELVARARLGMIGVIGGRGDRSQAHRESLELLRFARSEFLDSLAAETVLEVGRWGALEPSDLDWAGDVFAVWENLPGTTTVDFLLASEGDRQAADRWRESPVAEIVARNYPQRAEAVFALVGESDPAPDSLAPLEIQLFGPLTVRRQGHLVNEWPSRKDQRLLGYLATHLGRSVHEETLMDLFWPKGGKKAQHSLHNSVTQIRRVLQDGDRVLLRRTTDGYTLDPGCWVDVARFQEACAIGMKAARAGRWDEALGPLQRAEKLAGADFFQGSYEEWIFPWRLRLESQLCEVRCLLAGYFDQRGKHRVAADMWERVLHRDNCCEAAYLGLFRCYQSLGRQADAVKVYHTCVKVLKEELDLGPPPQLAELYFQLVNF